MLQNNRFGYVQLIIIGKIEENRNIAWKKLPWIRNIPHWTGLDFVQLTRTAEDRLAFASAILNLH